ARISDAMLRTKAYQRIFHGIYVCSSVHPTPRVRAQAALCAVGTGAYASHQTAAQLWAIPVPLDGRVHVTAPPGEGRNRRRGVVTHRPSTPVATATRVNDGIVMSTPEQVFCDLATTGSNLVDLVVAGDAILSRKLASRSSLEAAVRRMPSAGIAVARRALTFLREGVDSPMESRLRMLLLLAGLPEPQVNVIVRSTDGSWLRRFDLCYCNSRVIVEYDGRQHADDPGQWESDIYRREQLERMGYRIVIVTATGIYREPGRTLDRVAEALKLAGSELPRRRKVEWQQYFPGQS
ncbi:MAG: DUF559 domain-containing protein, partial [Microlunatus sp.]|nr:DUF559 domain-containing protein [Microlunatus sp.]